MVPNFASSLINDKKTSFLPQIKSPIGDKNIELQLKSTSKFLSKDYFYKKHRDSEPISIRNNNTTIVHFYNDSKMNIKIQSEKVNQEFLNEFMEESYCHIYSKYSPNFKNVVLNHRLVKDK